MISDIFFSYLSKSHKLLQIISRTLNIHPVCTWTNFENGNVTKTADCTEDQHILINICTHITNLFTNLCFLNTNSEDVGTSLGEPLQTVLDGGASGIHLVLILSLLHTLLSLLDPGGIQQTYRERKTSDH